MKRKIVQHGSSSLTLTLPKKWVNKFNLKKSDELEVEEAGSNLIVSTNKEQASPKKELSTDESGIFTKNNLSHLYQLGYDEVVVRFKDSKTLEDIKKRLPACMGFEIIDQTESKVYIKAIATTMESEFDTLLRKSFQITNEMAKNILEALQKVDYEKLDSIRNMETLNNKFTDVCTRILNKKGYKNPHRTMQIYEIVKNIERIADEFKYICDALQGYTKKLDKELVDGFKKATDYYLAFYNMFYKFDPSLKKKLYTERKTLVKKFAESLKNSRGINSLLLHNYISIVQKTYEGAGAYFALVL